MRSDDTDAPAMLPADLNQADRRRVRRRQLLLRRIGRVGLVALAVLIISFSLIRLSPGDPVLNLLGDEATPELVESYRERLGLDEDPLHQFSSYLIGSLRGDLGESLFTGQAVSAIIGRTLPVTVWLVGVTVTFTVFLAVPLALLVALRRAPWIQYTFRIVTSISLATPVFFSGLLAILFFSVFLGWVPLGGYESDFPANLRFLWLPSLVISGGVLVPIVSRVLHSSLLETQEEEFLETAIVRGLPRRQRFWRYLLKPSLAPTVALIGYMIGRMIGGAVLVEIIFNLPGIASQLVRAVNARDYAVIQGIVLVLGIIVVVVNFMADVISSRLDPRISLE